MNGKATNRMPTGQILGCKLLLAAALFTASAPALSAEYWLRAESFSVTLPDGVSVPMWGYAQCTANFAGCGAPSAPGPELVIAPGDTTGLTVHLRNTLPEPSSLVINGQITVMTPVWTDGTSGPRTNPAQRVRSFTHEAAARVGGLDGNATYTWPTIKPGTYLYQSGTHPQVQVQMGLYGAMISDGTTVGQSSGVVYDKALTLLFSEIDPVLHTAVANGTYGFDADGNPLGGPTSTLNYKPAYFLINGKTFNPADPALATYTAGERVLTRFLNAGLRTRVPMISNGHLSVIAEDGNPYPWGSHPRQQYTIFLPAAKTMDALFVAQVIAGADATYTIYDRRLALNNNAALDGGMMALIKVNKSTATAPPVIVSPPPGVVLYAAAGTPLNFQVYATAGGAAPLAATLGLKSDAEKRKEEKRKEKDKEDRKDENKQKDKDEDAIPAPVAPVLPLAGPVAYSLEKSPYGSKINEETGDFSWTPGGGQVGKHLVVVRATTPTGDYDASQVYIDVAASNQIPVAAKDSYTMVQDSTLSVAAPGVLANDSDADMDALTAVNYSSLAGTVNGNADGSFTYKPSKTDFVGTETFTYSASDRRSFSAPATVTVNVIANRPPIVNGDTISVPFMENGKKSRETYTPVLINVLANDYDSDAELDTNNRIDFATVKIVADPDKGGVASVDKLTGVISYKPKPGFKGTEKFTYTVKDTRNATSKSASVQVIVK